MGYVITFAGCPVAWTSKLQTEFALISTEAEFIALSEGLRSTIPLIEMVTDSVLQERSANATVHAQDSPQSILG